MDLFIDSIKNKNIEKAIEIYKTQPNINIAIHNHYLLKTAFRTYNLDAIKYIINIDNTIDLTMENFKLFRNISKNINGKKYIGQKSEHYKTLEFLLENIKDKLSDNSYTVIKLLKLYIKNGQLKIIKLILKYITNISTYSLLKCAVLYNKLKIAKLIYSYAPNVDLTARKYYLFRKVIENNFVNMAIWLYSLNPKKFLINPKNIQENHIIKKSALDSLTKLSIIGSIELFKQLVKEYPDIDIHAEQDSAFSLACEYNHLDLAKWFYYNYPMINVSNDDEYALTWALCLKNVEIYEWLYSIKPDIKPEVKNNWLFSFLCLNDLKDEINWLFEKFPYLLDNYTNILFTKACAYGRLELAKRIYNHDQSIGLGDSFVIAVNNGQYEIIKWFYELNPDIINHQNINHLFKSCILNNVYDMNIWLLGLNMEYIDIFKYNLKNHFKKLCKKGNITYLKWLMQLDDTINYDIFIGFHNAAINGNIKVMKYLYKYKMTHYNGVFLYDSVFESVCNNYSSQPDFNTVLTDLKINYLKIQLYDVIEWFLELNPERYFIIIKNNKIIDWNIFHIYPINMHSDVVDCPICLNRIGTLKTNCSHYFCRYCINKWTITNEKCPMCRQILISYSKLIK